MNIFRTFQWRDEIRFSKNYLHFSNIVILSVWLRKCFLRNVTKRVGTCVSIKTSILPGAILVLSTYVAETRVRHEQT